MTKSNNIASVLYRSSRAEMATFGVVFFAFTGIITIITITPPGV